MLSDTTDLGYTLLGLTAANAVMLLIIARIGRRAL